MKTYNIGAVARLTGITVHNLRIWEKRHNAVTTVRTAGGRRVYDDMAVERLVLLKGCVDHGASISHIAGLPNDELKSTLAALTAGAALDARTPQDRLCLVGSYANQVVGSKEAETLGFSQVERHSALSQLRYEFSGHSVNVLLIDEPAISEDSCQAIIQAAQITAAPQVHVIYRYARQRDLLRLRAHGYQLWNAPVDRDSLLQALGKALQANSSVSKSVHADKPAVRRFSDEQLARLSRMASRVECECPRHLSELIIALCAFESYSNHCENRNADDAALHLAIYRTTGKARSIMEDMLATVLKQEGINIDALPGLTSAVA